MFTIKSTDDGIFELQVSGKLTHQDYKDNLIPAFENILANNNKVNILIEAKDFHGWTWQAAWDDFSTGIKHRGEFNRVAIIGIKEWQANLCKLFSFIMKAEIKSFNEDQHNEARQWLKST